MPRQLASEGSAAVIWSLLHLNNVPSLGHVNAVHACPTKIDFESNTRKKAAFGSLIRRRCCDQATESDMRILGAVYGQILLFCATGLVILANMGQLTGNMVARNIRLFSVQPYNDFENGKGTTGKYDYPIGQNNGIRPLYAWGLYNYCGGSTDYEVLRCSPSKFGFTFNIVQAVADDIPANISNINLPAIENQSSITNYTRAAFYLLFVGTILVGVAFLVSLLFHPAALSLASILTFLGFAVLVCGASIDTYFINQLKNHTLGIQSSMIEFGNALWMFWAAVGAALFAMPGLIGGAAAGHADTPY